MQPPTTAGRAPLTPALTAFLASFPARPALLGLGEPTHGDETFPALRNELLTHLVDHEGYRSVALETDALAAWRVDDHVTGRSGDPDGGDPDAVLRDGITHGFGGSPANRALVRWLRATNRGRRPDDQVRFLGIDGPMEMTGAPSPRAALALVRDALAARLGPAALPVDAPALDELAGADGDWSDPAAMHDPARSVGATPAALRLRALATDLAALVLTEAPRWCGDRDGWWRVDTAARTAVAVLRYHAAMAATDLAPGERLRRLIAERDLLMAGHLDAVLAREAGRGPTLVFAHNAHLQRTRSGMRMGEHELTWWSAGAITAARHPSRYAVLLGSCGASPARGVPAAPPGTPEALLDGLGADRVLVTRERLTALLAAASGPLVRRGDLTPAMGYGPLDPTDVTDAADGVLHVVRGDPSPRLTEHELRDLLGGLPDVVTDVAGPDTGAPEIAWGDTFFSVAPAGAGPSRMPFATIVVKDYPGHDEAAHLDRPGSFALNIGVGRALFAALLGFGPAAYPEHADAFDAAARGVLLPHPVYARQGWVRVVDPVAAQRDQLLALAAEAARRHRPRADAGRRVERDVTGVQLP